MKLKIDRTKIPTPSEPRPFHFPEFKTYELPNKMQTLVVHKNNLPLVNVLFRVNFSSMDDEPGKEGQANLLSHLLLEGTQKWNSTQIAEKFENLGAHYNVHLSWSGFYFELNILKEHLAEGLELSSEIIYESILPEKEFNRLKQEVLIDRLQIKDMPGRLANERLLRHLFQNHRYGQPIEGLTSSIEKIELAQLHQLYKNVLLKRQPTLIFTGNITETEAVQLRDRYFVKQEESYLQPQMQIHFKEPEKRHIILVHKPNAAQVELRIGQFTPPRQHPDFFKLKLLNEVFGGYFLSRLNLNLREKRGYTYGIHSQLSFRPQLGLLLISASIQSEFIAPALDEIFKETEKLKAEGVREDELRSAAGYLIGVFPTAFETIDQISDAIANLVTYNLSADYYRTFREKLAQVTVEQVNEAAQKYLHLEQMQVVLVGDRTVVEKPLEEKYELQIVDVKGNPLP